jgi:transcriptional regulator with XRE-family HTH domain
MPKQAPRRSPAIEIAQVLGSRVRELREGRGWSQSALAQQLRISKSMIAKYEGGVHVPPLAVLVRLADVFAVTTDSLLGRGVRDPRLLNCLQQVERMDPQSRVLVVDAIEGIVQAYCLLFVRDARGTEQDR